MQPIMRKAHADDYWRIRAFLRGVLAANHFRQRSWDVQRFDYWRWHGLENIESFRLEDATFVWETPGGEIAAVLNPEGMGDAFLQVHPAARTPQLEDEMITAAEDCLSVPRSGGSGRCLRVWAFAADPLRPCLLLDRGYTKSDGPEYARRRPFAQPIPATLPANGYTIRALGGTDELPARSWASWRAFHPGAPASDYGGWEWYRNIQRAPLYRRDLDLVAVSSSGEIAGFTTTWFDDVNRTAIFEPVGVVPEHQRRGLGLALMHEGLRRLEQMGAWMAYVGSSSEAAGALYASAGFTDYELCEPWERVF